MTFLNALLAISILVGACKEKTQARTPSSGVPAAAFAVKSVDKSAIESLLDVKISKVKPEQAEKALSQMGLTEGSEFFEWAERTDRNGRHTYTNLRTKTGDGDDGDGNYMEIGKMDVAGAHMGGDAATFDRVDMYDVALANSREDWVLTIDRFSLSNPSPALTSGGIESLRNPEDINIGIGPDDVAFGAVLLEGLELIYQDTRDKKRHDLANEIFGLERIYQDTGSKVRVKLDTLGWGEDRGTAGAMFLIKDMKLDATEDESSIPVSFSLESASGTGLNMDYFRAMDATGSDGDNPAVGAITDYTKVFDTFSMKNLSLDLDTLSISTDGMSASASQKGKVTTFRQTLQPVEIGFSGEPKDAALLEFKKVLEYLELEDLALSFDYTAIMDEGRGTMSVENGTLHLRNVFRLDYDYKIAGLDHLSVNLNGETSEADIQDMVAGLELLSMNVSLTDESLVEKVFAYAAEMQGTSPQLLRMQAKGALMLSTLGAQNEAQRDAISDAAQALSGFMDGGGTLKIGLSPQEPLSAATFQDIDLKTVDPSKLGFSISHEK